MDIARNRLLLLPEYSAQIDWGNPLTSGLSEVIIPAHGRTVIGNIANTGVAHSLAGGSLGRGVAIPNSITTQVQEYAVQSAYQVPLTLIGVFERTQTSTVPLRLAGSWNNGVSGFGFIPNNTNVRASFARTGNNQILTGGAFSVGRLVVAAYVLDGSTANVTHTLYEDGIQTATAAAAGSVVLGSDAFRVGRCADSSTGWGANHYLYALYSRALSAAEIAELCRDPVAVLQLFNPGRVFVPGFTPSGGSTVVDVTKGNYTVSGKTPQVTQTANQLVDAVKGNYLVSGKVPTVTRADNQVVAVSKGSYTYTGKVPSVSQSIVTDVAPSKGSYVFTGKTAVVEQTQNQTILCTKGVVSYSGKTATVVQTVNQVVSTAKGSYTFTGKVPTVIQASGGPTYPDPSQVLAGVLYGPTGTEYTGTLVAITTDIKLDITTGRLVKPINDKIVMSL